MSYDGFFTHAMVNELKEKLVGGSIKKIYQPFEQEIHMQIRSKRKNYRLAASIHPSYYRLHLTNERPNNPEQAPMFTMVLRKHIENSQILDIRQVNNDRIVEFVLTGRDELGDQHNYILIFELMGRHSNILLIDNRTNKIIDCIKHISPALNSFRGLQPGCEYIYPPKQESQTNILKLDDQELLEFSTNNYDKIINGQAHQVIQGMSKIAAKQIQYWLNNENVSLDKVLPLFIDGINNPLPTIIKDENQMYFYVFNLNCLSGKKQSFESLSHLVDIYYIEKVHYDRIKQITGDMIQKLNHIINKDKVKLNKLNLEQELAENSEEYRIYGELLSAYNYMINKGDTIAKVPNYYNNDIEIEIPLEPHKSPIENSQAYFKKYSKYKDSLRYIHEQKQITNEEIEYLEGILVQLSLADISDVESIKEELFEQGYISQKKKSIKKRVKNKIEPRKFKSTDGTIILAGRNNHQNDELSLKLSSKNYWWLHAKNIPGSHIIIESEHPTDQTITEAASVAAYYSKSQSSSNVPVDIVQIKQLRKPNGAKPGYVIYEGQKTIYVTPSESLISNLTI